jgi:hypothetical protein
VVLVEGSIVADGATEAVLGGLDTVARGLGTTVADIAHRAGLGTPYPTTVRELVRRVAE